MGPRASMGRCGKSRLHRDLIPGPSSPLPVAILTELPGPHGCVCRVDIVLGGGGEKQKNPFFILNDLDRPEGFVELD